jgi:hypothetical protein
MARIRNFCIIFFINAFIKKGLNNFEVKFFIIIYYIINSTHLINQKENIIFIIVND